MSAHARNRNQRERPEPAIARGPGMPAPSDDACLAHLHSRLVPDGRGWLYGSDCACVLEALPGGVRVVIARRGE